MSYKKSVDELLNGILTDYQNQYPEADTSKGSLIYVKSAALASALWGLYEHQDYIARQIFPDTADTANLEHWAYIYGLTRKTGEPDADLLKRLLNRIQQPPAGGNKNDYEQWALEVTNVKAAYCYPLHLGLATVGVLIVADSAATGSEKPSDHTGVSGTITNVAAGNVVEDTGADFDTAGIMPGDRVRNDSTGAETTVAEVTDGTHLVLAADIFAPGDSYSIKSLATEVKEYIESVQPILPADGLDVFGPEILSQNVTMALTGEGADAAQTATDVEAYLGSLKPGQTLYVSQLVGIGLQNGADNATVDTPTGDVVPDVYQKMIRPGVVNVTVS